MVNAADVKALTDILSLIGQDTHLKKVANTGGGEYAGPCPFCGGQDRLRVQVEAPAGKKPSGSRWMCRQCSPQWGDAIGYVMRRDNLDFQSALEQLNGGLEMPDHKEVELKGAEIDRDTWVNAALEFLENCVDHLWSDKGASALNWLHGRGLDDDSLRLWNVGYNPANGYGKPAEWGLPQEENIYIPKGIVIPCHDAAGLHYLKIRRRAGDPKYILIKGGELWPFGLQTYREVTTAFLFEGEFDVMLAYQTSFTGVGYASLPAGQHIKLEYQPFFHSLIDIIVAYDNDSPGKKAANQLCRMPHFHKAHAFPMGNDLTEYYQGGGDVFEWLYQQVGILDGVVNEP